MIGINHDDHFCEEYVKGLEKEKEKILVFRRELPLCLQLVTQAIEACKQQLCVTREIFHEDSESDEQIVSSKFGPIVGEFFPISRTSSDENNTIKNDNKSGNKKSDWLKSAQLWNQYPDSPIIDKEESPTRELFPEVNGSASSGAFHPFKTEKRANSAPKMIKPLPPVDTSSSGKLSGDSDSSKKEKESKGKARRSWSHELHKRFIHALQQLGGSHVATPKQIREVMKVDGLTNDEVKSHLQKYRLHERRPNASLNSNNQQQAPQYVVVGQIWVPPPEYAMATSAPSSEEASRTANRVYAPVATTQPHHHFSEKRFSGDMASTTTITTSS